MTHRGPIVRSDKGRWIAFAMMDRPVEALQQSFLRTKASDLAAFMRFRDLKANSSNNAVFADDKGEIAVLAPQFMPRRDNRFDYTRPVDGSDPATDWRGLHELSELPNTINPVNGWVVQQQRLALFGGRRVRAEAERASPNISTQPARIIRGHPRDAAADAAGAGALDRLQTAAYDSAQPSFEVLVPMLVAAMRRFPRPTRAEPAWPSRSRARKLGQALVIDSVPQHARAILGRRAAKARGIRGSGATTPICSAHMERPTPARSSTRSTRGLDRLQARLRRLAGAVGRGQPLPAHLARDRPAVRRHGAEHSGRVRLQQMGLARLVRRVAEARHEAAGTAPTATASSRWSSSAKRVHARAVTAGGESGHPESPHFNDEALRYASGDLREVYFYPEQLKGHTERTLPPRRVIKARELVRGAHQPVEDAGLVEQMAAVGDDVELDLGPCLFQLPRGDRRRAGVVSALDDDAGDALQLRGARAAAGLPRASRGSPCNGFRSARRRRRRRGW